MEAQLLRPIFAQHDRSGHAERQALLQLAHRIRRAAATVAAAENGDGGGALVEPPQERAKPLRRRRDLLGQDDESSCDVVGLREEEKVGERTGADNIDLLSATWAAAARGSARLFVAHTPCLSCVAVLCQFRGRYSGVQVQVAFDEWSETRARLMRKG